VPSKKKGKPTIIDISDIERLGIHLKSQFVEDNRISEVMRARQEGKPDNEFTKIMHTRESWELHAIDVMQSNTEETACYNCPHYASCRALDWNMALDKDGNPNFVYGLMKVVGCSMHPDQERFKGHSTNVVITDLSKSGNIAGQSNGVYNTAWEAANGSSVIQADSRFGQRNSGGTYQQHRAAFRFDTSALPPNILLTLAHLKIYMTADNMAVDDAVRLIMRSGATYYPSDPMVVADFDYNRAGNVNTQNADVSFNTSQFAVGAYASIRLFSLINSGSPSFVNKGDISHFYMRTGDEFDKNPPGVGVLNLWNFEGPTHAGGHDPKYDLTYIFKNPGGSNVARTMEVMGLI